MATTPEEIRNALRGRNGRNRLGSNQRSQGGRGNVQQAFTANPTGTQAPQNAPTTLGSVNPNIPGDISPNIPQPTEIGVQGAAQPGQISQGGSQIDFTNVNGGSGSISGDGVATRLGEGSGTVSSFDSETFTSSAQDRTDLAETRAARANGFSSVEAFRAEFSGQNARAQQARIDLGEQRILARRDAKAQQERIDSRIGDIQRRDQLRGFSTTTSAKQVDNLIKQQGQVGSNANKNDSTLTRGAQTSADNRAKLAEAQRNNNLTAQNKLLATRADATEAEQKRADTAEQRGQTNSLAERRLKLQQSKAVASALNDDNLSISSQQRVANAVSAGGAEAVLQSLPAAQTAIAKATAAGRTPQATQALLKELTDLGFSESDLQALSTS